MRFRSALVAFCFSVSACPVFAGLLTTAAAFRDGGVPPAAYPGASVCASGAAIGGSSASYVMPLCDVSSGRSNIAPWAFGDAEAQASYGALNTFVHSGYDGDAEAIATAQFSDSIILTGTGIVWPQFQFHVAVRGTSELEPTGAASYPNTGGNGSILDFNGQPFDLFIDPILSSNVYSVVTFTPGPVVLGSPFYLAVTLSSWEYNHDWLSHGFSSTAELTSVLVLDGLGKELSGIGVTSASGSTYPFEGSSTPEPSSVLMAVTGLAALSYVRLLKRRRLLRRPAAGDKATN